MKNTFFYHYGAEIPIEEVPFPMAMLLNVGKGLI